MPQTCFLNAGLARRDGLTVTFARPPLRGAAVAACGRARRIRGSSVASRPHVVARRMPRTCVCTNPNCDKDVERFAFALGRHWRDETLKSILSSLRPKADPGNVEKYFLRAMRKPDAVRVSSRHFFWHQLAWSRGDRPRLVFKDGAHVRPTYMLHSNRPTYAGEPIVDPARVEWSAVRETRLRPRRAL